MSENNYSVCAIVDMSLMTYRETHVFLRVCDYTTSDKANSLLQKLRIDIHKIKSRYQQFERLHECHAAQLPQETLKEILPIINRNNRALRILKRMACHQIDAHLGGDIITGNDPDMLSLGIVHGHANQLTWAGKRPPRPLEANGTNLSLEVNEPLHDYDIDETFGICAYLSSHETSFTPENLLTFFGREHLFVESGNRSFTWLPIDTAEQELSEAQASNKRILITALPNQYARGK